MAKEKILVTGATGTTGKRTVRRLRDHGRDVRAVVHKESEASESLKSLGVEEFIGEHISLFQAAQVPQASRL